MLHYALGDPLIRALTLASRSFFEAPPDGFSDVPLGHRMPVLIHARDDELAASTSWTRRSRRSRRWNGSTRRGSSTLCPLRTGRGAVAGWSTATASGSTPTRCCRARPRPSRATAGRSSTARALRVERRAMWTVTHRAGTLLRADPRQRGGCMGRRGRAPPALSRSDLRPLRRTIITFDAPEASTSRLPFAKTVGDELYFAPESGRLFASPMDEVPDDPATPGPTNMKSRWPRTGWRSGRR